MITYPSLTDSDARKTLTRWIASNTNFGEEWVLGPELFDQCSWPVIQRNRVSEGAVIGMRQTLAKVLPPDLSARPEATDLLVSQALWTFLSGEGQLSLAQASDRGLWRWMSVRVLPDLVYKRSGNQISSERFLGVGPSKRCWPQRLYWMAWMCADGAGQLKDGLLLVLSKTDIQSGLLERTGSGYDREMYQSILSVLQRLEPVKRAMVTRGMMKRLTAIRGTRETCMLTLAQKMELSEELLAWASKYYRSV